MELWRRRSSSPAHRAWAGLRHSAVNALSIFIPIALSLLLYRDVLNLLLYYDDVQLMWVERNPFSVLLTSTGGMPIYRPLPMILWKALRLLLGGYDPVILHGLNLFLHILNTCLVWVLAYRLFNRVSLALIAALIFTAFPFSYEAVAWITALFHPLVATFVLMSFLLYLAYRHKARSWMLGGSLLLFWLALMTHENAFVLPLILVGWELAGFLRYRRPIYPWIGLYGVEAGLFFVIALFVMERSRFAGLPSLQGLLSDALFILQGWFFPLAYHISDRAAWLGWPPVSMLLVLSALFVASLVLMAWRRKQLYPLFHVGLWTVMPMLPIIFLDPRYVLYGRRLFYLSAVGISMAWALPLWAILDWIRRRPPAALIGTLAWAALVALIAVPSWDVLSCNLDAYKAVAEMLAEIERIVRETPPSQRIAFVNLPLHAVSLGDRSAGCVNPFFTGTHGLIIIPPYPHWVDDYLLLRGLPRSPVKTMRVEEFDIYWATYGESLGLNGLKEALREGMNVHLFDLRHWRFFNLSAHWQVAASDNNASDDTLAQWGDVMALVGHHMALKEDRVEVSLRWRALRSPAQYYTVFVHIWNGRGEVLAQEDAMPADNYIPTAFWGEGDEVLDQHTVMLPPNLAPDHYWVAVGVYDSNTLQRLPALAPTGARYQGDLYVIGEFDHR